MAYGVLFNDRKWNVTSISTGSKPAYSARSSDTGWAKRLRFATQKNGLVGTVSAIELAEVGEDLAVRRTQELECPAPKDVEQLAQRDHVAGPVQQAGLNRSAELLH